MSKDTKEINITFPAHVIPRLGMFCSTQEVRYYLGGIHIDGEFAVATDGHRMGIVHVPGAKVSGFKGHVIVSNAKEIAAMAKKAVADDPTVECSITGTMSGQTIRMGSSALIGKFLIDGVYPDWRRVVPVLKEGAQPVTGSFNPKYLGQFAEARFERAAKLSSHAGAISVLCHDATGPAMVLNGDTDFVGVLMPMRVDYVVPPWLPKSGQSVPSKTHAPANKSRPAAAKKKTEKAA